MDHRMDIHCYRSKADLEIINKKKVDTFLPARFPEVADKNILCVCFIYQISIILSFLIRKIYFSLMLVVNEVKEKNGSTFLVMSAS